MPTLPTKYFPLSYSSKQNSPLNTVFFLRLILQSKARVGYMVGKSCLSDLILLLIRPLISPIKKKLSRRSGDLKSSQILIS